MRIPRDRIVVHVRSAVLHDMLLPGFHLENFFWGGSRRTFACTHAILNNAHRPRYSCDVERNGNMDKYVVRASHGGTGSDDHDQAHQSAAK